jgi:hypothetical protein
MTSFLKILKAHWLAICLVSLGTWLRFAHLPEQGILFSDSGRDLIVAAEAVEQHELPLLGIPSSVPRFRQGPLTIWLSMAIYSVVGYQPQWYFWIFAGIGSLAMIGIYELSLVWLNKKTATIALALLSVSPLAVAHSRMVYHIVPIPFLMVVSLWTLGLVWQHRRWSWGVASLAIALLFQHELSLFPVFIAIPLCWWLGGLSQGKTWQFWHWDWKKPVLLGIAGLLLGLLPQILSELLQRSGQLTGFALWLGYRLLSFLHPGSSHFGLETATTAWKSMLSYWSWIITTPDQASWQWIMFGGLIGLTIWAGWLMWRKKIIWQPMELIVGLCTLLITAGYSIHGAPSEAYFPVYAVLWPLCFGILWSKLPRVGLNIVTVVLIMLIVKNVLGIQQLNFYVDTQGSRSYGPSLGTQQQSLRWLSAQLPQQPITLSSTDPDAHFEHYLDSYLWLAKGLALSEIAKGTAKTDVTAQTVIINRSQTPVRFTDFHKANIATRFFTTTTTTVAIPQLP